MQQTNRLGLIAVLATLLVFFAIFGVYKAVQSIFFKDDASTETVLSDSAENNNHQNQLNNSASGLYQTDQFASENTEEIEPLTQEEVDSIKEQLNVPSADTFTGKYLAQLPADMPREDVLDPDRITSFVNANKGSILPEISKEDILITEDTSKEAIQTYLGKISPVQNPELKHVTSTAIEEAHAASYTKEGSSAMDAVIQDLTSNLAIIKQATASEEVVDLHLKLVAASQALLENVKILQNTSQDFVGGLIAAKRIEDLGIIFSELDQKIKEVESKYEL